MATLPAYVKILFDGFQQTKQSGILRTEFESGPPRQARFQSRTMTVRDTKLYINSKANFLAFQTWFNDDIDGGALFFDMTDPVSGNAIEGRIIGGTYSARPFSAAMDSWEITCQIESWGE